MDVTLEQVASEAGVSVSTVSRAIRETYSKDRPSAVRRAERIRALAEQMGYRPNFAARATRTGRTRAVGFMLIEGFSNSVYLRLAERVTEAVRDLGFRPTIGLVAADATAIRDQVANWQSERLEGVFVGPLWQASLLAAVEDAAGAMPVVTYGAVASPRLGAVVLDFDAVWQRLLDHLRSRGHDKIGWVGQTIDWEAAARTGLPLSDAALATLRAWTLRPPDERNATDREDALRGLVDRWRSADPSQRPTAFMCNNDNAAMYLMTAFREAGVAIPQEVSITGLDNVPESRHLSPPLTTMDLNIRRIAERATALLMERIDEPTAPPRHERRVPELVVRESVGPPH